MAAGLKAIFLTATLLLSFTASLPARAAASVDVIPLPMHVIARPGSFVIRPGTSLIVPPEARARSVADFFAQLLLKTRGVSVSVREGPARISARGTLIMRIDARERSKGPESYTLDVSPDGIVLSAPDSAGLLYAAVTLWELCTAGDDARASMDLPAVPMPAARQPAARPPAVHIPAMRIEDAPRFRWRGLMLDSARHVQSPEFILRLLDWMALHKLNVLQWHLTDDQGWRLQIRKYPRLTDVGAWRVPAGAGPAADIDPATGRPRLYGGFYTQAVVRQIVAHAATRNITIVPEIDMPGHATAAIVAYPALGSASEPPKAVPADWGIYPNLFNVEDRTFNFLEDVLAEVLELFPSPFIDVGGDEAVKEQWHRSEAIQTRMRELGIANEADLQSYFMRRIEKYLHSHGRRLVGWDEILEGGLPPRATVMSWRGIDGAVAAARQGHDAVMSPSPTLYLDNRQGTDTHEPPGRGQVVTLADVYRFNPLPDTLRPDEAAHVLGVQANIWTEHIRTEERVQYMTFPRAAALAEVGWSSPRDLDWQSFESRLPAQLTRYRALDIQASDDAFRVQIEARPQPDGRVEVQLTNQAASPIRYTLDGSDPTPAATLYRGPIRVPAGGELKANAFAASLPLAAVATRSLDADSLAKRFSQELRTCTNKLVLNLEDDAPSRASRAIFLVDILNPCWIDPQVDLTHVTTLTAAVGQVPFNFQIGADRESIRFDRPQTAAGELEVRIDDCHGERIAALPLAPALARSAVTELPPVSLAPRTGVHDLCLRFTQPTLDPLWVLDWVQPK